MAPAAPPLRLVTAHGQPGLPAARDAADAALIADVRAGKSRAAGAFHDRVRPVVERTLGRLLGAGDSDRDDLTQQALIDLVLSVDRFRGECPLDAWAAVIAARTVYKHIRRRKIERRLFVLGSSEALDVPDRAASPAAVLRSSIRRVERHLRDMNRERAWTFVLHEVHGFSLKEISDVTGASVAAVQSRLVRGRRELHERIADDPDLASSIEDLAGDDQASHG
jgi:RNA polymerase sigma-70 factor (ECF subfamily)